MVRSMAVSVSPSLSATCVGLVAVDDRSHYVRELLLRVPWHWDLSRCPTTLCFCALQFPEMITLLPRCSNGFSTSFQMIGAVAAPQGT